MNTLAKLGTFNVWANATLLRCLEESTSTGHQIPANALRLFSHVLNAQAIWISRINDVPSPVKVWQEHDLPGLHHWHHETSDVLRQMCERTDPEFLGRVLHYANSQGNAYDSVVSDILTHAVVHASYHRGQVATRLREAGLSPINTDFITYCRELGGQAEPLFVEFDA